jgi:hypothetical protein
VVTPSIADVSDKVWDLIGDSVIAVRWSGPRAIGVDPSFGLQSGGQLKIVSDAHFDTWVIHTPTLVLVGPLR